MRAKKRAKSRGGSRKTWLAASSPDFSAGMTAEVAHPLVDRTLKFAARHRDRPLRFCELLRASGMSRRGFYKAFNKHTGTKPGQLLRKFRIERAKQILVEQDLGLDEIAGLCGYRSANTFCVAFRNATGMAPKQYQRKTWLLTYYSNAKS